MKNANAFVVKKNWVEALSAAATVANGFGGLEDGSKPGDWRLPNLRELQSLLDYGRSYPSLPENHPFIELLWGSYYWTSTTSAWDSALVYDVAVGGNGLADAFDKTNPDDYVWCVRGGR